MTAQDAYRKAVKEDVFVSSFYSFEAGWDALQEQLEAQQAEVNVLNQIIANNDNNTNHDRGQMELKLSELQEENHKLNKQVEVLTNLSICLIELAQKLDPIGAANFYKTLLQQTEK